MSGTVSVGAYTAGVIDFLVEAMDDCNASVAPNPAVGSDYERWTISARNGTRP